MLEAEVQDTIKITHQQYVGHIDLLLVVEVSAVAGGGDGADGPGHVVAAAAQLPPGLLAQLARRGRRRAVALVRVLRSGK